MKGLALGRIVVALLALAAFGAPLRAQLVQLRHWTGQGVAPVYEGYDVNPDGTFNMWFGYMNRNYEEEPDIPVGPDNSIQPGGPDRGQPTHFMIRRHKDIFSVTVPKDFASEKLVWILSIHGQSQQVTASLDPVWMIDRKYTTRGANIENPFSNTPPAVNLQASAEVTAVSEPITLTVSATDDGRPMRNGKPVGMSMEWTKYRGPGQVVFDPPITKLTDGKAQTTAKFGAPGAYILQGVVDDGSGEIAGQFGYHCCWTNVQLKVTVK